ncbi:hypothetical protein [Streptomyces sp. NPDC048639]|uniref:hypothetical protein n=1 Tax=Streptomyces sp. NPDC048639 TaxID=3365581 RepID=UPI0037172228
MTRGEQELQVGGDVDADVKLLVHHPNAAPPLPSDGDVRSVTGKSDSDRESRTVGTGEVRISQDV